MVYKHIQKPSAHFIIFQLFFIPIVEKWHENGMKNRQIIYIRSKNDIGSGQELLLLGLIR